MKRTLVTLTGPSCTGKSTVARKLVELGFVELISTTTRTPRQGEVEGVHYYFRSKEGFEALVLAGKFIETVEFNGEFYGMTASEVEDAFAQGKPIVLVCEPNGAAQIRAWCRKNDVQLTAVYLNNPIEVLLERYLERVRSDGKTPLATHVSRILNLLSVELAGRFKGEWDLIINRIADEKDGREALDQLLVRTGIPRRSHTRTARQVMSPTLNAVKVKSREAAARRAA